jgi:hypothetical protein
MLVEQFLSVKPAMQSSIFTRIWTAFIDVSRTVFVSITSYAMASVIVYSIYASVVVYSIFTTQEPPFSQGFGEHSLMLVEQFLSV